MIRGVVEGFYGRPYSGLQRENIINSLSPLSEPAYMYAPKNDPYHRLEWRSEYPPELWSVITSNMHAARESGVRFIFGISPWGFEEDQWIYARDKAQRAIDCGASNICILFDDIPEKATAALAEKQLAFADNVFGSIDDCGFLCPSIYCIELMDILEGMEYLEHWRMNQIDDLSVLWTGDAVISRHLDTESLDRAEALLGCSPVIWDNLLADDYTLRRIFLADLEGRPPAENGYLLNPSACYPVAMYGVHNLLKASGIGWNPPLEISGNIAAWNIISGFHNLPWSAGSDAESMMKDIVNSATTGASEILLVSLQEKADILGNFVEQAQYIEGGFDLMPYIQDVRKLLVWWLKALKLPSRQERLEYLQFMMRRRLPFDHPLALLTCEFVSGGNGEV